MPIAGFIAIAVPACVYFYFHYRARAEYQQTVRSVVEKGQQLTPEFLERLDDAAKAKHRHSDLRWRVLAIALGIGIASFGFLVGEEDAVRPLIATGNVPFLLGIAFVGLWKFAPKE